MRYDIAIVGGGIIGLATALALTERRPGAAIAVVEKESQVGSHQSGHNSNVLHSGIYYRPGSLKARLCVEGARAMADFVAEHGLPLERRGKVIVAVDGSEVDRLDELQRRGEANHIGAVRRIGPQELAELEPHASGIAALHVSATAVVDFPAITSALAATAGKRGVTVITGTRVTGVREHRSGVELATASGPIEARFLVNCGGLHADRIARMAGITPPVRIVPFRGEYYRLVRERRDLVRTLVYPVPDPDLPFLGVHLTRGWDGDVHAGPNAVLALAREGYGWREVSGKDIWETLRYRGTWSLAWRHRWIATTELRRSLSRNAFARAVRRLIPEVETADLLPAGSGVRAQAVLPDGALADDFVIVPTSSALHVLNAPSPGATASLAIGAYIAERVTL